MVPIAFVTLAALTLSPARAPHRGHRHHPSELARPLVGRPLVADPNVLYSVRARKRMVTYLKLRLLELRELHLTRAAEAIERRLPLSELLSGP